MTTFALTSKLLPALKMNASPKWPVAWPASQPVIETNRLILRPLTLKDAGKIQVLAGDFTIADTTLNIAHPYPSGLAEKWIAEHPAKFEQKEAVVFAVILKGDDELIGIVSLGIFLRFRRGELGYWITKPFWNQGLATEAGRAIVAFGLDSLGLHKIEATHLSRNPASGKVLRKIGFEQEGVLRAHVLKWDCFEDVTIFGLLAGE